MKHHLGASSRRIWKAFFALFLLFTCFVSKTAAFTEVKLVSNVLDGDSFEIAGNVIPIRMLGINTNETGDEDGHCHAEDAKVRLIDLIEGEIVTLSVDDPSVTLPNMEGVERPVRWVDLGEIDIGELLLSEGLALPYAHETEIARINTYLDTAAKAQQAKIGIWDSDACGVGPQQELHIELIVSWDAVGDDSHNVNGEWIDIINHSDDILSLTNWRLRDPATRLKFYEFVPGDAVPAGRIMRVHIGVGTDTALKKYWGRDHPLFTNDIPQGAYLLDPDNDIRASFSYPCRIACTDPMQDKVTIHVNYDAEGDDRLEPNGEWIDLINSTDETIELYGYFLDSFYHFEREHHIAPKGKLRIKVGIGTDSASVLYRNNDGPLFTNSGGIMSLRRADNLLIDEYSWPESEPPPPVKAGNALSPVYLLLR